jgi:hypothetical protein
VRRVPVGWRCGASSGRLSVVEMLLGADATTAVANGGSGTGGGRTDVGTVAELQMVDPEQRRGDWQVAAVDRRSMSHRGQESRLRDQRLEQGLHGGEFGGNGA